MEREVTSASLRQLIRRGVAARVATPPGPDASKTQMLRALLDACGPAAVVQVGRSLHEFADHPLIAAVTLPPDPVEVLARWIRLERFGHASNRTRLAESSGGEALLEHVNADGDPIDPVNDLFMWGVLIALIECAGSVVTSAELVTPGVEMLDEAGNVGLSHVPPSTTRVRVRWRRGHAHPAATAARPSRDAADDAALPRLLATDPLKTWRIDDAARALGVSARRLQRRLQAAGTSFTEVVHRTRIDAAQDLIAEQRLSLTEIAFCTGFSDLAHFSRVFRRFVDVPPSAMRDLLRAK